MAKKIIEPREIESVSKMYELMVILSPELLESALKKKLKEITKMIEDAGGKTTEEDIWGKRDLSYKMKGFSEGNYAVLNFEAPQTFIKEFREFLRIEKEVLRSMILTIPADYVYTKYDMDAKPDLGTKKAKPARSDKNVSVKHNAPVVEPKKEKKEDKEEGKEPDAKLDEKLDSILEGGDLNL